MPKDVWELVEDVRLARLRLAEAVMGLTEAEAAWRESADAWSIKDNVEHIVLAEQTGVNKIWTALVAGAAAADSPNRGLTIEQIVARTWQPQEKAPPGATPSGAGPLAYWVACLRACQPVLEELGAALATARLEDVVYPHFLSGPLDARQRLEFLRFHADRHVEQVRRTRAAMATSS